MTIALETKALRCRFGAFVVTNDVSLQVEQGARHALIGPNGAGKTTLINLLTGVLKPSAGQVLLGGEQITGLAAGTVKSRIFRARAQLKEIVERELGERIK